MAHNFVPVVDANRKPLMPTSGKRARKLIQRGDATPFFSHGIFCIRLNRKPSGSHTQPIAVGVDPGSKREGFSVRSQAHDYLNLDADAKTWIGKKLQARRVIRRARRYRKTPCRKPARNDDNHRRIPAGTRARWDWKLQILKRLARLYPITHVVVENVAARTRKGKRRWNQSFSPLEVGKQWFYNQCRTLWTLSTMQGYETKQARDDFGPVKTHNKLAERFEAHCVDAWVLAASIVGGTAPTHRHIWRITPIQRQRRCLHLANPTKGGVRKPYGGTNKGGFKTGTLVRHPRYGLCYTGGTTNGRLSLHNIETGRRLTQKAKTTDCQPRKPLAWRFRFLPALK